MQIRPERIACLLMTCLHNLNQRWAAGEIDSKFDPVDLAEFLLASWEGAILRMKVERAPAALERFKTIIFNTVFKEQK
jgi:TetR/AcrR family transcriptional repressor of nem operon